MKKSYSLLWFVLVNVGLVLLSIYKESIFIALVYEQQRQEKKYETVDAEKKKLTHELEQLKNYQTILAAQKKRGLVPLSLSRVRRINVEQSS